MGNFPSPEATESTLFVSPYCGIFGCRHVGYFKPDNLSSKEFSLSDASLSGSISGFVFKLVTFFHCPV